MVLILSANDLFFLYVLVDSSVFCYRTCENFQNSVKCHICFILRLLNIEHAMFNNSFGGLSYEIYTLVAITLITVSEMLGVLLRIEEIRSQQWWPSLFYFSFYWECLTHFKYDIGCWFMINNVCYIFSKKTKDCNSAGQ